jgi:hypothetical protein
MGDTRALQINHHRREVSFMSVYDLQGLEGNGGYEAQDEHSAYTIGCCNPSPDASSWSWGCYHSNA